MARLSPTALRMAREAEAAQSEFLRSWKDVAPDVPIMRQRVKDYRGRWVIAGQGVILNLELKADPRFRKFLSRLDRMPAEMKKEYKRILRTAINREIVPRIKMNIPRSESRKKHLRATAGLLSVNFQRAIVGVGSSQLWYGAIVHAGRSGGPKGSVPPQPFFTLAFRGGWHPLNRRLTREMYNMLGWLAKGHLVRRG